MLAAHGLKRPRPLTHHHLRKDTEAQEDFPFPTPPASQPSITFRPNTHASHPLNTQTRTPTANLSPKP